MDIDEPYAVMIVAMARGKAKKQELLRKRVVRVDGLARLPRNAVPSPRCVSAGSGVPSAVAVAGAQQLAATRRELPQSGAPCPALEHQARRQKLTTGTAELRLAGGETFAQLAATQARLARERHKQLPCVGAVGDLPGGRVRKSLQGPPDHREQAQHVSPGLAGVGGILKQPRERVPDRVCQLLKTVGIALECQVDHGHHNRGELCIPVFGVRIEAVQPPDDRIVTRCAGGAGVLGGPLHQVILATRGR